MRSSAFLTAAVVVTLASGSGAAFAADKDVVVVNTAAQPVPTTVQGTVSTSIQGTVSVKDVDHPARAPFADLKAISLADGVAQGDTQFDPVPAGKELVIETVTVRAQAALGQSWDVEMFVTTNGIPTAHFLELPTLQTTSIVGIRTATLAVRLYADAGTQVTVHAHRQNGSTGLAGVDVSVSGHHVDVP